MFEFEDEFMKSAGLTADSAADLLSRLYNAAEADSKRRQDDAYRLERETYRYTFEPFDCGDKFRVKFNMNERTELCRLKTSDGVREDLLFFRRGDADMRSKEKELNHRRFVVLSLCYEDRYSDDVMESAHGKYWRTHAEDTGKPVSPFHLESYNVIFDTEAGEVVYHTEKEPFHYSYIWFFDNVAKIKQDRHDTVYFDLPNRKVICTARDEEMIETADHLIIGKTRYYNAKRRDPATVIDKRTCETTEIS